MTPSMPTFHQRRAVKHWPVVGECHAVRCVVVQPTSAPDSAATIGPGFMCFRATRDMTDQPRLSPKLPLTAEHGFVVHRSTQSDFRREWHRHDCGMLLDRISQAPCNDGDLWMT